MDLSRGDPATFISDADTQHARVDTQLAGDLRDRPVGIDHAMSSLDLVLGPYTTGAYEET
jgi:hypothetical protein